MGEIVILMASGLGSRMRPMTERKPKPLIKIGKEPMIETIICGFMQYRRIDSIFIVIGYLKEQFKYLEEKYSIVHLVENPDYMSVNNISSIYYAKELLRSGCDCFISEADLFLNNPAILTTNMKNSCYFGKMINGYSDDWVFDLDFEGYISRVGKGGWNCYNMAGISWFKNFDAAILANCIENAYGMHHYEDMFWDDVVNQNLDKLKLRVFPIGQDDIVEIDTVEELKKVRMKYINCRESG